jgi:hypothetical protein
MTNRDRLYLGYNVRHAPEIVANPLDDVVGKWMVRRNEMILPLAGESDFDLALPKSAGKLSLSSSRWNWHDEDTV